jgi:PRTRC genetic system ThiF family protein
MQRRGQHAPELMLVDPDRVEPHNVGRQLFTVADCGAYKAETLARRFSFALGLPVRWIAEPFDAHRHADRQTLLCGAVDNHLARQQLCQASQLYDIVYIDAGNAHQSGQVVVGNSDNAERILNTIGQLQQRHCAWLPHVGLVFPSILEPEQSTSAVSNGTATTASCARAVEFGDQHILVNDAIATVAAHYSYTLLLRRPLTSHITFLDMESLNVKSPLLTRQQILHYCKAALEKGEIHD